MQRRALRGRPRIPTLSEHVIDVLRSIGRGSTSLGARTLIDAHSQNPTPLNLNWEQLNKPLAHLPYSQTQKRKVHLQLSTEHYDKLMNILDANIATQPRSQRIYGGRGKDKARDMASPLTALANKYSSDDGYRAVVQALLPPLPRPEQSEEEAKQEAEEDDKYHTAHARALMHCWAGIFGDGATTSHKVHELCNDSAKEAHGKLRELFEVEPDGCSRGAFTSRRISRRLSSIEGRVLDRMAFTKAGTAHGGKTLWRLLGAPQTVAPEEKEDWLS